MKFFKNRYVIGILCIIIALHIVFFAIPALQSSNQGGVCQRCPCEAIHRGRNPDLRRNALRW
jgi:hypothetical protein